MSKKQKEIGQIEINVVFEGDTFNQILEKQRKTTGLSKQEYMQLIPDDAKIYITSTSIDSQRRYFSGNLEYTNTPKNLHR